MVESGAREYDAPTAAELDQPLLQSIPPAVWLAVALAAGISFAWHVAPQRVWPWLIAAGLLCVLSAAVQRWRCAAAVAVLCGAMVALGVGWMALRSAYLAPHDLAAHLGNERELVRVRGVVLNTPELRQRRAGSLAQFDYRKPATYFQLRVEALRSRVGSLHEAAGRVLVRVDEAIVPLSPGDTIDLMGYLLRSIGPHNPGEFDYERYARTLGQAGMLTVPSRELITLVDDHERGIGDRFIAARASLRQRSSSWLLSHLPIADQPQRDALLTALLLGEREPALDGLMESFQKLGLAHLLAISGMHLTILVGMVLLAARFTGRHGRWQGWLMIGVVLLYLFLVEARSPVLRAGIMSIAASLGVALDRRLRISSLVALSAIALLLWQPQELFTAGFQLSYGVVLALLLFTAPVRARWSRKKPHEAFTTARMFWEACKTSSVVAIVAWLFATPLVMHHFGFVSIVGIPLSIIATPLVSGMLLLGYAKLIAAVILPSAAVVLGWPLIVLTDILIWLAKIGESLPLAELRVPQPSMLWTLVALAWLCTWLGIASDRWRRRVRWLVIPIVIWAALPAFLPATSAALRIDMLSVGDGSCYLLRSGDSAVVFDAGSSSSFDAGRRTIVPALRALRVRTLDAVVISHANLDHYSGVLELVDAFSVREVIVSPHFLREAESNAPGTSPVAFLTSQLAARNVPLRTASDGVQQVFGEATWTWLHPTFADSFRIVNNTSMVIRVDVASRTTLLAGDIQADAIDTVLRRYPDLRADVSELPHHGSFNDDAAALIERINPSVILQSTGWMRWRKDRWAAALAERERLVTARDGACWIEVDDAGNMTFGRFRRWLDAPTHDEDRWE